MRPGDAVIYKSVALLFAVSAAVSSAALYIGMSAETRVLEIISDGLLERAIVLSDMSDSDESVITVRYGRGSNEITVRGGEARVTGADCPGGDCVKMPAVRRGGDVTVCLPHRLILRVVSSEGPSEHDTDAVSR